ncbi:transcriptional regulator [Dyadobacter beijingensis]|uniref:Transcriptional regulator n=1 Tax=Dyadobacter beijingensis TaxID=365489 RepID=A0ABQ2IJE8_9BACT|nr:helix-turn-helix domain-containing protein [Dyadobacter beijingensis]GGN12264.1 transcriptional regulator [Dyadobacter beijingensis]
MTSLLLPQTTAHRFPQLTGYGAESFDIATLHPSSLAGHPAGQEHLAEMIWLTQGRFQIMFDLETYEVSEGKVLFLAPGQRFFLKSISPDLEGTILRFPAGFMPADFDLPYPNLIYRVSRIFEIDEMTAAGIASAVECMRWELTNSYYQKTEVLAGYLKIVLIYLSRQRSTALRSAFKADMTLLARRFLDLLERQYHVHKRVSEYADELAVTPNYLNQIVKQETGMSASANIRKRLLLQAKRMALLQGMSMKTVAYKLGFDDTAHFSKFFKMGCGCNFTTYRKMRLAAAG